MCRSTEPVGCPEVPALVIIVGDAASQAEVFHQTAPTNPLQAACEPIAQFVQNNGIVPDLFQTV
jgi:hypothetical protein